MWARVGAAVYVDADPSSKRLVLCGPFRMDKVWHGWFKRRGVQSGARNSTCREPVVGDQGWFGAVRVGALNCVELLAVRMMPGIDNDYRGIGSSVCSRRSEVLPSVTVSFA